MMTNSQARYFLLAQACMARIAAMQALNDERRQRGESQAYDEESFLREAQQIEILARDILEA